MNDEQKTKLIDEITKVLVDKGELIEAGFAAFVVMCLKDAPMQQIKDMRMAFFAGAQHTFSCTMTMFDPTDDVTEQDMDRLEKIQNELQRFIQEFAVHMVPTVGGRQ